MALSINFNEEKNQLLQATRGICFTDAIEALAAGKLLADLRHQSPHFPHQRVLVLEIKSYAYAVPYVINTQKEEIFLKTIYPSRRITMLKNDKQVILDDQEQLLEDALAAGEFEEIESEDTQQLLAEAAQRYQHLNTAKPITIRINQLDLIKLKARAKSKNIPYQTLVGALIHEYAEGERDLVI